MNVVEKVVDSVRELGFVIWYVGLNEQGIVEAKCLSTERAKTLLSLYDKIEDIPKEYQIYYNHANEI